ncbi:LEAF RUST 10 DISEASE-RESISTANCE LOCUS RECEPTOR-LIKE PROTEIN KINASE-like 2.4 isoform X2 [Populus nigra]|uniref:LEAF RUST 10 DISEASE-RESISTANCE LOCUS RECEPTOR-LIKE PROTEIN KINASE-like 2.4 isoform X2 n=1 Tax=Populus nigra TaxID=3691 RepID=UPI002B264ADB|nr:LEAF RUST 10 DISEASE-RESISTANCE LOCUS RECEPTOR-LIKE PROTEIN KINASE-like 2.4 isoform X2 [Populus nigra]
MHPLTTTSSFLLTLFFSLHLTTSLLSNDTGNLSNCNQNFSCGNLTNVTYPFTGGLRPSHCGPPEFGLTCEDESVTILKANSLSYRVTHLDQTSQTLRLSRSDLYDDGKCTRQFTNTTLDDRIFSLGSSHELYLFYGCKKINDSVMESDQLPKISRFSCDNHGVTEEGFFSIVYPYGTEYSLPNTFECQTNIRVPILSTRAQQLFDNESVVGEVLKEGFDVSYSNPYSANCTKCYKEHPGGYCGFDTQLGKPICVCNDQLCPGSSMSGRRLQIGAGTLAAVAAILTLSIITIYLTRREGSFSAVIAMTFRLKKPQHVGMVETFMMDYHSLTPKRYLYSDIKKMTKSFVNTLGEGGFGNVYRGKLPDNGRLVAVKILKESKGDGEEFMNEVASISRTSHVNVVTLLGFCYERNKRALIYEFMPNGSLDNFLSDKGSPHTNYRLEWKKLYEIAVGIARGLEYLHRGCNTRIVHFDIKPHNILLDEDFCPKISDFGLAKLCKSKVSKISMIGARGTIGYIAPEVFCRSFGGVTYKSDVYSYGMMVLEMVGQSKDFDMGSLETNELYFPDWFYMYLDPGEISTFHGGITEEENEIVKKMILVGLWCIQTIPSHRPSMTKVVEMFEGSLQSLQIPPRPSLSSPRRSAQDHSSTVSSLPCVSSQGGGVNTLFADESDL